MRSRRYKQHRAADGVSAHIAGWHIYGSWYPMNVFYGNDLFYKMKNIEWWESIHRYIYKFTNDYDAINHVYSNMELCKHRKGSGIYEMSNNHYLLRKYYETKMEENTSS